MKTEVTLATILVEVKVNGVLIKSDKQSLSNYQSKDGIQYSSEGHIDLPPGEYTVVFTMVAVDNLGRDIPVTRNGVAGSNIVEIPVTVVR